MLWVILGFIFIRGILSIISGESLAEQAYHINERLSVIEARTEISLSAKAFAENFVVHFYTFTGAADPGYIERVSRFLARGLDINTPTMGVQAEVLNANAIRITEEGVGLFDVDVVAIIRYTMPPDYYGETVVTERELTIRVPLAESDGRFAVDELPQFVPPDGRANITRRDFFGQEVEQHIRVAINAALESFFRAYYAGSASDLAFFTTREFRDRHGTHGLHGLVDFHRITRLAVFFDVITEEYVIDAIVQVNDKGQLIDQRLFLRVITDAYGRYYVNSISTRM